MIIATGLTCGRDVEVVVPSAEPRMAMAVNVCPVGIRLKEPRSDLLPMCGPKPTDREHRTLDCGTQRLPARRGTPAGEQDRPGYQHRAFQTDHPSTEVSIDIQR